MGMNFTVSLSGRASTSVDLSEYIDANDIASNAFGYGTDVEDAELEGLDYVDVTIAATVTVTGVELSADAMDGADATQLLRDNIDSYDVEFTDVELEVEEGPTGFDEVESAIGRDDAIAAYVALANAGYEVTLA